MASSYRLISQFNPDSYSLSLDLNKKTKLFEGSLTINGSRKSKSSYRITLNQKGLRIASARIFFLDKKNKTEVEVKRIVHHTKLQEVRLHTDKQITSGRYIIELKYKGRVSTKGTNGFYVSRWQDENLKNKEILTTQFETHYARQLLPCIDEPEAKATFKLRINLSSKDQDTILFNTEIESDKSKDSIREIEFRQTPVMSSYLLALVVGELDLISKDLGETKLSIYSTPDKIKSAEFALDFASKCLKLLEQKFQTPYPLDKLDLVAVPDFDAGGMENWGLITFREDLLLFSDDNSTLSDKQSIALVIAHELAHQWFGNLVTMKWWDELWLNEGFANFMEYYLVNHIHPEWNMLEQYLITEKNFAIRMDSLPSSRPIVNNIISPHHAVDSFDAIAYEKSGSIIRMIFNILGENKFMLGLKDYFEKFSYKSASSDDLLSCWQEYSSINLKEFTRTWLYEPGLPKIEITLGNNSKQICLHQSRFLSELETRVGNLDTSSEALGLKPNLKKKQREFYINNLKNSSSKEDKQIWQIPISLVNTNKDSKSSNDFVMKKKSHSIQFKKNDNLPLKINKSGENFYISSYPEEMLTSISESLKKGSLEEGDALNILGDIIMLNRAGQFEAGSSIILELIMSAKENYGSSQFWSLTTGFIGYLHYHLKQNGQEDLLNKYINNLVFNNLDKLGFDSRKSDRPEDTMTRFELLSLASLARQEEFVKRMRHIFEVSSNNLNSIDSEKRILVFYSIAKDAHKKDYDQLIESYKSNLNEIGLRDDLAYGLAMFESKDRVENNIRIMQDPELVRDQDIISWLSQIISSGKEAKQVLLDWIIKNDGWEWLDQNLSQFDKSSAVKVIISSVFSEKELSILKKFFQDLQNIEIEKSLRESLDIAKSRINWHKMELPRAVDYLKKYRGSN